MMNKLGGRAKSRRKKRRKAHREPVDSHCSSSDTNLHDVHLNDFANATGAKGAFKGTSKKMISSAGGNDLSKLTKQLNINAVAKDVIDMCTWYERSDFDDIEVSDIESEIEESCDILPAITDDYITGNCYPLDVWCLLAGYIKPEQIRSFAAICRNSYEAVNSAGFWIRLYHKFIANPTCLPARLKPDWIKSRPGLQMRVVRALFIGYKNLRNHLQHECLEESRNTQTVTSELVGLRCCRMWYQSDAASTESKTVYSFYFKFRLDNQVVRLASQQQDGYLKENNEQSFIILKLTVLNFLRLISVCGETLTDISVNMSRNMRYNSVKLIFHHYRKDGKYRKGEETITVLDPVSKLRLLRWWHPTYPHYCEQ